MEIKSFLRPLSYLLHIYNITLSLCALSLNLSSSILGSTELLYSVLLFPSNHNFHKSSSGFCFLASNPLIDRF